jgi:uncharacterized protein
MADASKRLQALDQALAALGDDAMLLSQFDGLVAGLLVCPELIPPSEWLGAVWGEGEDDGVFESAEQLQATMGLIMAHYNEVADTLRRCPGRYQPIYGRHDPTDETFWEFWIEGFATAVALRPVAWLQIADEAGEAADALALLATLDGIADDDPVEPLEDAAIEELRTFAPDIIPECVAVLAARRFTVRTAAKPGRNDPCPCGSGKKYKKCCALVQ